MAELMAVRRTVPPIERSQRKFARMVITPASGGPSILVPYAPSDIEHTDIGGTYVSVSRPGLPDVVFHQNQQLPKMSCSLIVVDKRPSVVAPINTMVTAPSILSLIQDYSRNGVKVRVTYGAFESGLWYITTVSISSIRRDPVTDEMTVAEVDLSFTKVSDVLGGLGPVTGGVKPAAPPKPAVAATKMAARHHVMKQGDTLWGVSIKFYGTGTKWRIIADANGIKDVRKIPVGKELHIP